MTFSRAFYWLDKLGKNVVSLKGAAAVLAGLGLMWALVEPTSFFFPEAADFLRRMWPGFLVLGIIYAIWLCRPFLSTACKLDGRDVGVEIRIGDIFKTPGVIIIGTNTTFDTRIGPQLVHETSLQGQFTRRYFASEEALDLVLEAQLKEVASESLPGPRAGKSLKYPIGTTVLVEAKGVRSFWVAIAHMNPMGTAITTTDELQDALAKLWVKVSEMGSTDTIVMPALASRYGQLALSREHIVRLIIQSFLAACAEKTFCERLVIVLSADDVVRHKIDLGELGSFLRYTCRYSAAPPPKVAPVGVGVG